MTTETRRKPYPSYTRPDHRIIKAFQSLVRIIDRTVPSALLGYIEGSPHPLTNTERVQTGQFMGKLRTIDDYTTFLGQHGYFDFMEWSPLRISGIARINLQAGQDSIWVTSPLDNMSHAFGLHGTNFRGDAADIDIRQVHMLRHFVRNENHLIKEVMDCLGGAVN